VNRFPKIKEAFTVKPKMIFVDHYFRPYQTPKNTKIILRQNKRSIKKKKKKKKKKLISSTASTFK
jgi:hypothetical protein